MASEESEELCAAAVAALESLHTALDTLRSVYDAQLAASEGDIGAPIDMQTLSFEHGIAMLTSAASSSFFGAGGRGGKGGGGGGGGGGKFMGGGRMGGRGGGGGAKSMRPAMGGGGGGRAMVPARSMTVARSASRPLFGGPGRAASVSGPGARSVAAPRIGGSVRTAVGRNPLNTIRTALAPSVRTSVTLPSGYRLGRTSLASPWAWSTRSAGLSPYRIGAGGGYIFNPNRASWRPWGSYRGFLGGIGNLAAWLAYPWFNLWYSSYLINPNDPFAVSAYYARASAAGLPELGYVDLRTWTPEEIDAHVRELENVYGATASMGYRIIVDPATGRLLWVNNVRMPPVQAYRPLGL